MSVRVNDSASEEQAANQAASNSSEGEKPAAETAETQEASGSSEVEGEDEESERDDDSDETDSENDESKGEKKKSKKNGIKKRIDRFRRQLSEKDRELEYLRRENDRLHSRSKETQPDEERVPDRDNRGKPKPSDFDSPEEYYDALSDWQVDQKLAKREARNNVERAKSAHQKALDAHLSRTAEFAKSRPDFEDLIEELGDFRVSEAVEEELISSENGPEILYELAKNPDEFDRICRLPRNAAARAIGRIEERLKSSSQKREVKIATTAPPPIGTVGSKSGSSVKKDLNDKNLSFSDYEKLRMGRS